MKAYGIYRSDSIITGAGDCARPSSAMSPAGYSLALLSSNRLRFAGRLPSWGSSGFESTEKCRAGPARAQGAAPTLSARPLLLTFWPVKMRSFYSGADIIIIEVSRRVQVVVAEKLKGGAMQAIAAGPRDCRDHPA